MDDQTSQVQSVPAGPAPRTRLRLWPALTLAALVVVGRIVGTTGEFSPTRFFIGVLITSLAAIVGLQLWWLFASRARRSDRFLVVGVFAVVTAATVLVARPYFPGIALLLYALPVVIVLWPVWLLATPMLSWPVRRAGILVIFLATGAVSSMLRVDGMDGEFNPEFSWRWTPTAEQQLLAELQAAGARSRDGNLTSVDMDLKETMGDWPGFRGPSRDNRIVGVTIGTDWQKSPPTELWRRRIGPGWSSFCVIADRLFTQEQRGDDELVVCYDAVSGAEVWSHRDATRFTEVVAGPGPRATPTFHQGRLYALGANGKLNCLKASDGKLLWSRDIATETGATVPQWGFASSPLVTHGLVTVFAGAPDGKSVIAFNALSGEPAWTGGKGSLSYCSPQLVKLHGTEQVLINTDAGMTAFEPETGKVLWAHEWPAPNVARVVQPALVGDHDLLLGTGMGVGTRRFSVEREQSGDWQTKEQWTSRAIKPYYNDMVLFDDHLYGFDGAFVVCVSLKDGSEKWRERGYGNGQMLLLADQALLLILSEKGEVALVQAQPEKLEEVCKFKALDGKTWNHPVVAHGKLYVRNGEKMACFKLPNAEKAGAATR